MPFSSIFHFKFRFRRGVVLNVFVGAFWRPLRGLRAALGFLGRSLGGPWGDFFGSLEVLLAAVGCLRGTLGIPGVPGTFLGDSGAISGIFRETPGGLLAQFYDDCLRSFNFLWDFVV